MNATEILAHHFIVAAIWADAPEGTNPRPTKQAVNHAKRRAWEFLEIVGPEMLETIAPAYWAHPDCGGSIYGALGHDLWLTSQGHGAGFWDRNTLTQHQRDTLSEVARRFRGVYPECHRGWLYFHGQGPINLERVA